jgi:sugar phosphate isomerase/epimerase
MRVRTAIGIGAVILVAKAALTAVALSGWAAIAGPRWPSYHWHIELGSLGEWLAALAAAGAAIAALGIATRDRSARERERQSEEKTLARLVRLTVSSNIGSPTVTVEVRNYGPLPILDLELVAATWTEHPDARWGTNGLSRERLYCPMLGPEAEHKDAGAGVRYYVWFMHPTTDEPLAEVAIERTPKTPREYVPIDPSTVEIRFRFRTANGVRWETPTRVAGTGEPVRL